MLPKQYSHGMKKMTVEMQGDISKLNEHAKRLNLAVMPTLYASWQVRDIKTDTVEVDSGLHKCNSFTRNFYNSLCQIFTGQSGLGDGIPMMHEGNNYVYDNVSGQKHQDTAVYSFNHSMSTDVMSAFKTAGYGIALENVPTMEDFNDTTYHLITDGTGVGALTYMPTVVNLSYNYNKESKAYITELKKVLRNDGIYNVDIFSSILTTSENCLMERSNFPEKITLQPGKLIEVTYVFSYIFPEPEKGVEKYFINYNTTTEPDTFVQKGFDSIGALRGYLSTLKATLKTIALSHTAEANEPLYSLAQMFASFAQVESIDMSEWDGTGITSMVYFASDCYKLVNVVLPSNMPNIEVLDYFASLASSGPTGTSTLILPKSEKIRGLSNALYLGSHSGRGGFGHYSFGDGEAVRITSEYVDMTNMFNYRGRDLLSIDLSGVIFPENTITTNAFALGPYTSASLICYAATQENADMFNASVGKHSNVNFVVKPS